MVVKSIVPLQRTVGRRVFFVLLGMVCFGILGYLLVATTLQIVIPPPAHHLTLVQDIPVPSVLPNKFLPFVKNAPQKVDLLAPGVAVRFDHFDFQTLDPTTGLLFIAHTGPVPDKFAVVNPVFSASKDSQVDGHVLVFDTRQNKLVGRVEIPQIAGIVSAPDLGRVYAADANDNIVYVIDERTLQTTKIALGDNEGPDAMEYDQPDHKIFISDPGVPAPDNIDLKNQNIVAIDTITNAVTKINIGRLPRLPGESAALTKFGYDVGHNHYDPVSHRLFATIQQLTNQAVGTPPDPPVGTGELIAIDPVTLTVVERLQLPKTCGIPHGMNIDAEQRIAFVVCTQVNPAMGMVQNLIRVNVQTMSVLPDPLLLLASKPDIAIIDHTMHVLFIGCVGGVSAFDIRGGRIRKLGDYVLGKNTHTLAVDERTQLVYMPLADVGGRPIIRIAKYNVNGV